MFSNGNCALVNLKGHEAIHNFHNLLKSKANSNIQQLTLWHYELKTISQSEL